MIISRQGNYINTDRCTGAHVCISDSIVFYIHATQVSSYPPQIPISSSSRMCWSTETKVLAQIAPEAATAGRPMPGNVESPQQ